VGEVRPGVPSSRIVGRRFVDLGDWPMAFDRPTRPDGQARTLGAGRLTRRAAAAGLAAGIATQAAAATRAPLRVVSLNPCLDAILVNVADRGQIAALSHYSRDPDSSSIAQAAATLPITYESVEEVIALQPDLVLIGRYASSATQRSLQRLGVRTASFDVPSTLDESLAQVADIATLTGRADRGAALVARIRAAIAQAAPAPGERRLTALVYETGGFASAEGTLMDEMMRRAGFINAASRYGLKATGDVPLELLLDDPPDVLLAGQARPGAPTWADRVLTHPALAAVAGRMYRAVFPQRLMFCGGPVLVETARMLSRARREALARRT
jgi:iron complex transport system substrate-binding protein